jgi:hypothetical protein
MLLIGSHAVTRHLGPTVLGRDPCDVDLIGTFDETQALIRELRPEVVYPIADGKKTFMSANGVPIEVEIAWAGSTAEQLMALVGADEETCLVAPPVLDSKRAISGFWKLPSVDVLFALKSSHRFLRNSPHFEKTRKDYMNMRSWGARIPTAYMEWYLAREKETYNYDHPRLNVSKDAFFAGDGVKYHYDHDSIHTAMALTPGIPAYTRFQKEGAQVAVDRMKWNNLPLGIQLASVIEESMVLALERSQIPFPGALTPAQSFKTALQKVCTSISSGWWRDFAYQNYDLALARYPEDYVVHFYEAVRSGAVKELTP